MNARDLLLRCDLEMVKSRALSIKETKRILGTRQHSFDHEMSRVNLCDAFDLQGGRSPSVRVRQKLDLVKSVGDA